MALVYFESSQLVLVVEEICVEFNEKTKKINEISSKSLISDWFFVQGNHEKSMVFMVSY